MFFSIELLLEMKILITRDGFNVQGKTDVLKMFL